MVRYGFWMSAAVMLVVGLGAATGWAQDVSAKAAEKAIDTADPDVIDPNLIKGDKYTLDFQFERPEPIVVTGPAGEKQIYWYVFYTVTNRTGQDRLLVPAFTLFADTGAVSRAGIYPTVFDAIKKLRKPKFLENAVQMIGKVLVGEDNARTGVAIFAPLSFKTTKFTIFIEGLSGEYIERPGPAAQPQAGATKIEEAKAEADKATRLRKTLALTYTLPSENWMTTLDQPVFKEKKWTWR
ncbi:MAG: hypothetical protein NTY65_13000 [Planctomycetota bacterium]|nr:hypothetical protein [Planctomycetota bacterium]